MYPLPFVLPFNNQGPASIEQVAPTVVSASTTTSSATALPGNPYGDRINKSIRIENVTNGWAFCNFGDANVGAATLSNGVGVPPNSAATVTVGDQTGYVTVILNTGATSGNVRFVRGFGGM